jgi:hypothetical protein
MTTDVRARVTVGKWLLTQPAYQLAWPNNPDTHRVSAFTWWPNPVNGRRVRTTRMTVNHAEALTFYAEPVELARQFNCQIVRVR